MKKLISILLTLTFPIMVLASSGNQGSTNNSPAISNHSQEGINQNISSSEANKIYNLNSNFLVGKQLICMDRLSDTSSIGNGGQYLIGTDQGLFITNKYFKSAHIVDLANNLNNSKALDILKISHDNNDNAFVFAKLTIDETTTYHIYTINFSLASVSWVDILATANLGWNVDGVSVIGYDILNKDFSTNGMIVELNAIFGSDATASTRFCLIQENPAWVSDNTKPRYITTYTSDNMVKDANFIQNNNNNLVTDIKIVYINSNDTSTKISILDYVKSTGDTTLITKPVAGYYSVIDTNPKAETTAVIFAPIIDTTSELVSFSENMNIVRDKNSNTWLEMVQKSQTGDPKTIEYRSDILSLDVINAYSDTPANLSAAFNAEFAKNVENLSSTAIFGISNYDGKNYQYFNNAANKFSMEEIDTTLINQPATAESYNAAFSTNIITQSDASMNFYNKGTTDLNSPFTYFSSSNVSIMFLGGNIAGLANYNNAFDNASNGASDATIVGIVLGIIAAIILLGIIVYLIFRKSSYGKALELPSFIPRRFTNVDPKKNDSTIKIADVEKELREGANTANVLHSKAAPTPSKEAITKSPATKLSAAKSAASKPVTKKSATKVKK